MVVTYLQSTTNCRRERYLSEAGALQLPLGPEAQREEYVSGLRRNLERYEDLMGMSTPHGDDNRTASDRKSPLTDVGQQ